MTEPVLAEPHAKTRLKPLDAFRGIAITAVLLFHYTYRWGPLWDWGPAWPQGRDFYGFYVNHAWFMLGKYGVEFFFIISGFVIFLTLERCSGWRDFALRRFARLYPTYWVCMIFTFFSIHWFGDPDFLRRPVELLVGFTMLSGEFGVGWVDGAYWSLLIELIFYFWAALIYFNFRNRFVATWILFCALASLATWLEPGHTRHIFAARYLCYFTAGMGFYSLHAKYHPARTGALFVTAAVLYCGFYFRHSFSEHLLVAFMVLLFSLFVAGKLEWLGRGPLAFIGLVSYPLYLLHQHLGVSLIEIFNRHPALNGWPSVAITSAAAVTAATLVHYTIELPSQKWVRSTLAAWLRRMPAGAAREGA